MQTIPEKFKQTAEKFPLRPALKFKYQGTYIDVSFFELAKLVETMAKGLAELGVAKGDRIAILSENRTEWVRSDLAVLTLGAISVAVHTTLSPKIISHILNDSASKILVVSNQEQFNKVKLIEKELLDLEVIIYLNLDDKDGVSKKLMSLEEVMDLGEKSQAEISAQVESDDTAAIVYTSGTTALPKGVMLSHNNFIFNGEAAVTAVPVNEHDVLLSFLPLSHVFERTVGYYAPLVCRGSAIAYAEGVKTLKQNLTEVKPTILVAVPWIFEKIHVGIWDKVKAGSDLKRKIFLWALKQQPGSFNYKLADILVFHKIKKAFGGRLRFAISGGATLNHKLARFFSRIGITIVDGYGLTETSPVITTNRPDNIKFGTVGQHLAGIELKTGPDKEILTRGPHVMQGYYQNEKLTAEAIDKAGWFKTGDLGFIDEDGFLSIIGRKKEMIALSNGKIVWPEQIEVMLNDDRFINQSMVYGNNKSYLTALIIPDWAEVKRQGISTKEPNQLIKAEKLYKIIEERIDKINQQFADWEKIRKFTLLPKEFSQNRDELTPTLKLRRRILAEHYKSEFDLMYQ